jgi:RNA polymerase sigma factor (sigma-70 family)
MLTQMMDQPLSPLAQARQARRVSAHRGTKQLCAQDQMAVERVLTEKYDYVENEIFEQRDAMKVVFDEAPKIAKPDVSWYHPVMENLSAASRNMKSPGTVLLTAAEERALFLQFNYCRFRVVQIKEKVGDGKITPHQSRELLEWFNKAERYRDQIAQTNLALVLAMAKRTRMSEIDFSDLVSEGNMALLRAVYKFDVARGFKFSTYACRAILKAFSRSGVKLSKYRQMFPTDFDPKLERSDYFERKRESHEDDCVDEIRQIMRGNRADLTDIEQEVIEHRFGVTPEGSDPDASPLTLEQVGKIIGVTKERVRQIQNKALVKIRESLEDGFLG